MVRKSTSHTLHEFQTETSAIDPLSQVSRGLYESKRKKLGLTHTWVAHHPAHQHPEINPLEVTRPCLVRGRGRGRVHPTGTKHGSGRCSVKLKSPEGKEVSTARKLYRLCVARTEDVALFCLDPSLTSPDSGSSDYKYDRTLLIVVFFSLQKRSLFPQSYYWR